MADLPAAWGSLPHSPMILIAGAKLSADAYDSAWRLGVALERAGKRPRIVALPAVGDTVDLQAVAFPQGCARCRLLRRWPKAASAASRTSRKSAR